MLLKTNDRVTSESQRSLMQSESSQRLQILVPVQIEDFYSTKFVQTTASQFVALSPGDPFSAHNHPMWSIPGFSPWWSRR